MTAEKERDYEYFLAELLFDSSFILSDDLSSADKMNRYCTVRYCLSNYGTRP